MVTEDHKLTRVKLTDLLAHRKLIGEAIDAAILRTVAAGAWIMGPSVADLEDALASFSGAKHATACSNGTDAIKLALLALGMSRDEAVLCPTFTFAATAEAIALLGGRPVFVDCAGPGEGEFNLSVDSCEDALVAARAQGLAVRGIVAVDLFGVPAPYAGLRRLAEREGLWLVADGAQSFGATNAEGQRVGVMADITTTSFFPAKPLGCYGDGGAVLTDDPALHKRIRSLRVHGQGDHKYDNVAVGLNARLDTVQAAVLIEKLRIFQDELDRRDQVAERYHEMLPPTVTRPSTAQGVRSAWAQYTIRASDRDRLAQDLSAAAVDSAVYYPKCLHQQPAYADPANVLIPLTNAERYAREVLSLPMHPYLCDDEIQRVAEVLSRATA